MWGSRYRAGMSGEGKSNIPPISHDNGYNELSIEQDPTANMYVGADSVPAAQDPKYAALLKLSSPRPTYEKGITLLEHAYTVLEDSDKLAKGGTFEKNLGTSATIATEKGAVAKEADYLRKTYGEHNKDEMSVLDWQTSRDLFFAALAQYAGVSEGRAYQNKAFDDFIADIGKNTTNLVKAAGGSLKWVGLGLAGLAVLALVRR